MSVSFKIVIPALSWGLIRNEIDFGTFFAAPLT
jgi:hypothetical protein